MALNACSLLKKRSIKAILAILFNLLFLYTLFSFRYDHGQIALRAVTDDRDYAEHKAIVDQYYENRRNWSTSNLGAYLFKHNEESRKYQPQKKTFTILVWKYWNWLKNRHVFEYGAGLSRNNYLTELDEIWHSDRLLSGIAFGYFLWRLPTSTWAEPRATASTLYILKNNPFKRCSVKNCIFTGEDDMLDTADAVIVHLQRGLVPKVHKRPQYQRWIFLNDESPKNVFSLATSKNVKSKDFENVFNWSMTYRSDSDIPVPYGRTVALEEPIFKHYNPSFITKIIPNWNNKRHDKIAAILMSNCIQFRMNFIKEIQKYIKVDVYGKCSNNKTMANSCPGHFRSNCKPISEYLFYLALENSNCPEYLTEKIWHNAYNNGAIPVIMGPSLADCEKLLPPKSYIHIPMTTDPNEIKKLALKLVRISKFNDAIVSLHEWRNNFKVANEHGYFGTPSQHLCRVCEAMNYNSNEEKIYSEADLKWFLDPELLCAK